jgi:nitroimidazol reductase NimA-like FMN-containing flavoprotein (pyridoxamine 5'-phosphate oxidase superfamily)
MSIDQIIGSPILDPSDCWNLLRSVQIGRLAVLDGDRPDIFPINFVVDRGTLVFRTAEGTKLTAALGGGHSAFEVDGFDEISGQAWSVVVRGRLAPLRAAELLDSVALPLEPWQPGPKPRFIRIVPTEVSGRRFDIADASVWHTLPESVDPARQAQSSGDC